MRQSTHQFNCGASINLHLQADRMGPAGHNGTLGLNLDQFKNCQDGKQRC